MKRIVADVPDELHDWAVEWSRKHYGTVKHYITQHFYQKKTEIEEKIRNRRTTNKQGQFDGFDEN